MKSIHDVILNVLYNMETEHTHSGIFFFFNFSHDVWM